MSAVLKVVGGYATSHLSPIEQDSSTRTEAIDLVGFLGANVVSGKKDINEYWRDYTLYHHNVKSVYRLAKLFAECLDRWKKDTTYTSSMMDIVMHPAYQRIIGLGPDIVPYILQEMADNGGHWFWALQALTGENPIPKEDQGRTKKMTAAWLEWGQKHGLLEI